jgi:aminomethyltransferase
MGYALFGHEIGDGYSVFEAGLGTYFKDDLDCVGRAALLFQRDRVASKLVYFLCEGRRVARAGYTVRQHGKDIGKVCSGAYSPGLERAIGNAMVDASAFDAAAPFSLITERGAEIAAAVSTVPFISNTSLMS